MRFVVESEVTDNYGRKGVARIYVATEARAQELVDDGTKHGVVRTYRKVEADVAAH